MTQSLQITSSQLRNEQNKPSRAFFPGRRSGGRNLGLRGANLDNLDILSEGRSYTSMATMSVEKGSLLNIIHIIVI